MFSLNNEMIAMTEKKNNIRRSCIVISTYLFSLISVFPTIGDILFRYLPYIYSDVRLKFIRSDHMIMFCCF